MLGKIHEPTKEYHELAERLASVGVPLYQIAARIGVDPKTLVRYYHEDIQRGEGKSSEAVGSKLLEKALAGNVTALIFWAKCRMGWIDTPVKEEDKPEIIEALKSLVNKLNEGERLPRQATETHDFK